MTNGEKYAITPDGYGAPTVDVGDTARVYFAQSMGIHSHKPSPPWM
jgi:hypothetical protein